MASYPGAVYSPGTRNTGDIIQSSDVNNPNNEIIAIEQDLVNGAIRVSLTPSTDVSKNIGSASFRWQNFYSSALVALDVASRSNYLVASAAITGANPFLQASGASDATINFDLKTKAGVALRLLDLASIVNFLTIQGNTAGNDAVIGAGGTDAFVNIQVKPKGNNATGGGLVQIATDSAGTSGNHLDLIPAPNGNDVRIHVEAAGGDANRGLILGLIGTGPLTVGSTGFPSIPYFKVIPVVNAANFVQTTPALTGGNPTVAAAGTDSNIALLLSPKGSQSVSITSNALLPGSDATQALGNATTGWQRAYLRGTGGVLRFDDTTIMGITPKSGSAAGNYTTTTTQADVDATNLAFTVTIPTGWKLDCFAKCNIQSTVAGDTFSIYLIDGATTIDQGSGAAYLANNNTVLSVEKVIIGDGASHTVKLQWSRDSGTGTVTMINSTTANAPKMRFTLMPSN